MKRSAPESNYCRLSKRQALSLSINEHACKRKRGDPETQPLHKRFKIESEMDEKNRRIHTLENTLEEMVQIIRTLEYQLQMERIKHHQEINNTFITSY
jgi:hypothetical protein